jgi:transcription elongation factor SPT6
VTHLKAILSFRKFKKGSKAEVDELLKSEKSDYPMRIPYCFGVSYEHPGTFILFYIRTNLHHEYIGLHPKGFKFRKQTFRKVEQLIAYFQKHIDDLKHQPAQMTRPITGSPARASTECGNEGGWKGQLNSSKDELSTLVSAGKTISFSTEIIFPYHVAMRLRHHTLELVFLLYQSFPTKRQERCLNMLLTRFL